MHRDFAPVLSLFSQLSDNQIMLMSEMYLLITKQGTVANKSKDTHRGGPWGNVAFLYS